jgi:hypothetical protein
MRVKIGMIFRVIGLVFLGLIALVIVLIGYVIVSGVNEKEREDSVSFTCDRPVFYHNRYFDWTPDSTKLFWSEADTHKSGYGNNISSLCVPEGWTVTVFEY